MIPPSLRRSVSAEWRRNAPKPFDPKRPSVKLHEATYGDAEIAAFLDCLLRTEVTMGPRVRRFEEEFARKFGHAHAVMVNSGSSANLLAVSALSNPLVRDAWKPGDEVIVPALCWSTTVWPLIQHGLVPVVVDADPETLNLDPNEVERAIGPKTRGIMPVHIYGNPCDMDALMPIVRKRGLVLLEDTCESLGASWRGKAAGSFGRAGTFSFYYSHHITTLEGGMVVTDDHDLAEALRVLRAHGWVREMKDPKRHLAENPEIHPKFLFVNLGYNLRPTEPQGAMGSIQLRKLDRFIRIRTANRRYWEKDLADLATLFQFQKETPGGTSSWFGNPMRVRAGAPFEARDVMAFLGSRGIETRPLNAGNIAAQPALRHFPHRVVGDLRHASAIMRDGFTWGNHQHVDARARRYVADTLREFVAKRS
jgi:CDP-6-deoxy-D-xylo-4-hexulose-3-dehydrase